MRKILSEKNFAAVLFVLVIVAFSFAHEDSKKRDTLYNASYHSRSSAISAAAGNVPAPEKNTAAETSLARQ